MLIIYKIMSDTEFRTLINSCLMNVATAKITEYMLKMIDTGCVTDMIIQIKKIKLNVMFFITGIIKFIRNYLISLYGCNFPFLGYASVFIGVIFIIVIITLIRFLIKMSGKKNESKDKLMSENENKIISENNSENEDEIMSKNDSENKIMSEICDDSD